MVKTIQTLPEDIYGPVKNKPVLLQNGVLLCPSSTENDGWRVHMEITADNGLTWERTPPLNEKRLRSYSAGLTTSSRWNDSDVVQESKSSVILSSWSKDNGHHLESTYIIRSS